MFAERLRELRTAAGLKQEDLARILGTTPNAISKYETGSRRPSHEALIAIADYFNVSLDYLLWRTYVRVPAYIIANMDNQTMSAYNDILKIITNNQEEIYFIRDLLNFLENNTKLSRTK